MKATITSEGQITIPVEIRERLGLSRDAAAPPGGASSVIAQRLRPWSLCIVSEVTVAAIEAELASAQKNATSGRSPVTPRPIQR